MPEREREREREKEENNGRTFMAVAQEQQEMLIPHLLALCPQRDRFPDICDNQAAKQIMALSGSVL